MTDTTVDDPPTPQPTIAPTTDVRRRWRPDRPWFSRLAHIGVFGLVAEVAFVHLGVADAAPDEFTYRICAQSYIRGNFDCNLEHPPLAKEILGIGSAIFGDSITAARLTTAIFAVLTAYLCYLFCRDVAGPLAGLFAASMWGLLPQAGIESHTTLEAVRIDRFALLDPYVACFVALALVAGGRLARRGGSLPALMLGAAVAAAACSKAPGALIAPIACLVPLAVRRRRGLPVARDAALVVAGALVVGVGSYAPFGPAGAVRTIRFMFDFQTAHAAREVIVGGHFYVSAPWWSDLAFATSGLGAAVAITLAVLAIVGLRSYPRATGYAIAVGSSIVVGVGFGLHLSEPHYYIDWEPAVVVAAALGLARLVRAGADFDIAGGGGHARARVDVRARSPWARPPWARSPWARSPWVTSRWTACTAGVVALVAVGVLATGVVRTVGSANTEHPGPYGTVASLMECKRACVVSYVGYIDVLASYLPSYEYLDAVPPASRRGHVVARVRSNGRVRFVRPDIVALDPAAYVLHGSWLPAIRNFEAHWRAFGYERIVTKSRIEVFELKGTRAFG